MSLRQKAISGSYWTFAQQFGSQIVSFGISVILARILLPEEFGLIAMINILMGVGTLLYDGGLANSLIRTKNADQEDFSTVFYFNLGASILLYLISYVIAPLFANFFEEPILIQIIRIYCLIFIIQAFSTVQIARLTKKMDFKTQMLVSLPSLIIGGIAGVLMAYYGYGVWSLVYMTIIQTSIKTIQFWFYSGWKPSRVFSIPKFKYHFNFGFKMTLTGLLDIISANIYTIVIGKVFSTAQLGYYNRANSIKNLPTSNIGAVLGRVTYPLFSSIQDDNDRLRRVNKDIIQMVTYVIAPVLILLLVIAKPFFVFLLTDKWLPAVPYFQILVVAGLLQPLNSYNMNVLLVKGRSDLFLKLSLIKKGLLFCGVLLAMQFDIYALLFTQVILSIINFFMNTYYTNKMINYSPFNQLKDVSFNYVLAFFVGSIIYVLDTKVLFDYSDLLRLMIGGLLGAILYLTISYLLKFEGLQKLILILRKK
ncbi:Membrane protein involved in the export of O-antigen and teichoic acid [Salegentibacter agarivorans]|uniref:Membrane protein involved in the export of O-antigen and teichoic acid n=1 Tax=Salegentibacter agarivorans TaxID=345907 RepID=A0A1I2K1C7_9FLAO|nr:lipopolysaccharide biosynthesis protein [Salegentibacter agarivorans]SFF60143.1 Membrane protein involved in the export of O-antigen and teichoic acid [Salegentibacter agarivorans]